MDDFKDGMLFAPQEKFQRDALEYSKFDKKWSEVTVNWGNVGKLMRQLVLASFMIPFCSVMTLSFFRSVESFYLQAKAFENAPKGGEFDPTMGEKITSENGRALIVVHEGFGEDVFPMRYAENDEYQLYLRKLQAEKDVYIQNGDPIVEVVTDLSLAKEDLILHPKKNTLYFVTDPNNGSGVLTFLNNDVMYIQDSSLVWNILRDAGVDEVEMAGEFRAACVSQVAQTLENYDMRIGWCDFCAFPAREQMSKPEYYPTLEPIE